MSGSSGVLPGLACPSGAWLAWSVSKESAGAVRDRAARRRWSHHPRGWIDVTRARGVRAVVMRKEVRAIRRVHQTVHACACVITWSTLGLEGRHGAARRPLAAMWHGATGWHEAIEWHEAIGWPEAIVWHEAIGRWCTARRPKAAGWHGAMRWFETIGRRRAAWRVSASGVVWNGVVVCVCVCESAVLDGWACCVGCCDVFVLSADALCVCVSTAWCVMLDVLDVGT